MCCFKRSMEPMLTTRRLPNQNETTGPYFSWRFTRNSCRLLLATISGRLPSLRNTRRLPGHEPHTVPRLNVQIGSTYFSSVGASPGIPDACRDAWRAKGTRQPLWTEVLGGLPCKRASPPSSEAFPREAQGGWLHAGCRRALTPSRVQARPGPAATSRADGRGRAGPGPAAARCLPRGRAAPPPPLPGRGRARRPPGPAGRWRRRWRSPAWPGRDRGRGRGEARPPPRGRKGRAGPGRAEAGREMGCPRRLLLVSNSTLHGGGYLGHCQQHIQSFLGG